MHARAVLAFLKCITSHMEFILFLCLIFSLIPEFDLTKKMAPFLDIHMLFAILDWLSDVKMYPHKEILQVVSHKWVFPIGFICLSSWHFSRIITT